GAVEEGLRWESEGKDPPETPRVGTDELARVVVFATEILSDADQIKDYATPIQTAARHVLRNEEDLAWHETGEYQRYRARLAAWHLAEAERDRLAAEGTA